MDFPLRAPVLASQCYSPTVDYHLESCYGSIAPRQPLGESTGNAQRGQLGALRRAYIRRPGPLSSMPPSILTPPIIPTQSLGPTYGPPVPSRLHDRHQSQQQDRRKVDVNPLWLYWQQFQTYRKKQDEKDDKSDQKWPQVLEDAFLDGLMFIPHIGRKKFSVNQTLHGRNMLIAEYLWLAYLDSLPPDEKAYYENLPKGAEPDHPMRRGRKQVSSHIQVLKNIFKYHKCCHIFLPKEIKKNKNTTDDPDSVSLKRHPVLVAISEGLVPDERPNYDYFARILALNEQVVVRPKRCWIFVSNRDVAVREDGSGYLATTGERLARDQYPHIERNLEREKWAKEEQQIFQGILLHEYTKNFSQVESSALRELGREWKASFPDLHQRLEAMMATNAQGDILTAESQYDIIHMQVVLELNETRRFPSHSELNSWVEISIEKPHLLHHRWKVETRLVRPAELSYTNGRSAPELVYKTSAEIAVQYQHRPGCDGPRNGAGDCHCMSQHARRDWVTVPFPADVWAPTLSNCAEYPAHPLVRGAARRAKKVKESDDEDDSKSATNGRYPTQMDLVPQIAMMQEIWSCPPDDPHDSDPESQGSKRWTRRGVILWSFKTIHSIDSNNKLTIAEGGKTSWRFLTVLDPISEYHLQNSLVPGNRMSTGSYVDNSSRNVHLPTGLSASLSRDAVMSPSPTFQQHLNGSMSENFSAAWGTADVLDSMSGPATQAYDAHLMAQTTGPATMHPTGYNLLDGGYGGHGGLATPPPSACLTNSFSQSFETSTSGAGHVAAYMATGSQQLPNEPPSAHSFLGGAGPSAFDVSYNDPQQHDMHSWGSTAVTSIDTGAWPTGYITADGGSQHSHPALSWASTHTANMRSAVGGATHHPHNQLPQHHHWVGDSTVADEPSHWGVSAAPSTTAPAVDSHHSHSHSHRTWAPGTTTASCSSATDDEHDAASQGWEHVAHRDSCSAGGTVSDVSHEWEEADVSEINASAQGDVSARESIHSERGHVKAEDREGLSPSPVPRGVKRTREESGSFDGEGGFPMAVMPRLSR